MKETNLLKKEILNILSDSSYPVGARFIAGELSKRSYRISQASIGRFLAKLESDCFVKSAGKKGRQLSEAGRAELGRLISLEHDAVSLENMRELMARTDFKALVDVQEARIVIEPSLAFFAAENAAPEDLNEMRRILAEADEASVNMENILEYGDAFHIKVASAARKPILEAAFNIICPQRKWNTALMGFIQDQINDVNNVKHWDICEAITGRDREKASELMKAHLYSVYFSLKRYAGV
ncbi:MAG: FCD domain-containing protein [Synergistaceae bacterium]|jgi:DNA-binding GntR family transcriptional regulator|nr:FCD domain-containing protein [Synergistaceae bacterium]